jgi:hypothetical protein
VGFVLTKGPEIHILPLVAGRSMSRRNIHEFMAPILKRFGYCVTRVPISETDHRLRLKLGFTMTWTDDRFTYWAATELPYAKE